MNAALLMLAVACSPQASTPGDTLTLDRAVAQALAANPMLRAARLKAEAAQERVPQAGALPDPELSFGLMNRMVGDLGSTMDPMTMNQVQLTQMLPWPGKLGFAAQRARRLAQADQLDADDVEQNLVASVKSIYYQVAYMDRALAIMGESRDLMRNFFQVSQAMYSVGSGLQQDVLQAQVGVAKMTEDITIMSEQRVAMAARLNALLGRQATATVGALRLPNAVGDLPSADSLMALAARQRPKLRAAQERAAAAEAGYRGARRQLFPDLMLGVSYGQRPQFGDMATLMLGIRLPIWAGSRQLPVRREMQAMQAEAQADAQNVYNETYAQLVELHAEAERDRTLSRLYATSVVPQAQASVDAALAAYRVGKVNYMSLVDNQMTVNRYETESVRLVAAYHKAVAEIAALVGTDIGGGR
jgi:cobalt-zinc-cadmium efflux system outer membrane protein